jgi:4'-phosphopantetheinyl transferase EntD
MDRTLATIRFSAKESVYKLLSPITCALFGFQDVELLELESAGAFSIRTLRSLGAAVPRDFFVKGRFAVRGTRVFTLVAMPR